jgi:hypothetical protein
MSFTLSVIKKPFMLSVVMLNVVMLSVIMLNVVMMSVIMLNVVAPPCCPNTKLSYSYREISWSVLALEAKIMDTALA